MSTPAWLRGTGIVLLLLVLGELVARMATQPPDVPAFEASMDGKDLRLIPGVSGRAHMYGRTIDISIDAQGHRITVGAPNNARYRLDLIGDSQIFGWGLSDSETIASRLQALLGADWQVVNHGVPGIGPLQYARILDSVPKDAEVLLVFTELNDLWDTYGVSTHVTRCGFLSSAAWPRSSLICPILNLREVQMGFLAYTNIMRRRALAPIGFHPSSGVAARILAQRVRSMFVKDGVRVHPHMHFAVLPWDGRYNAQSRQDYFPAADPDAPRYFDDDYDLISAFAQAADPPALFLPDDPHLAARGAALFADRVAPYFKALSRKATASAANTAPDRGLARP
jgi:hypothetical protein